MNKITSNNIFKLNIDELNIVELCMQTPGGINKINPIFIDDFCEAIDLTIKKREILGVILTSKYKDFCHGVDFNMLEENSKFIIKKMILKFHKTMYAFKKCNKIIVAALNGSVLGGGYELALNCHYRIAVKSRRFYLGLPEVKFGLIPGLGATQRLPRIIGIKKSLEYIVKGSIFDSDNSLSLGLVDELIENEDKLLNKCKFYIKNNSKQAKFLNNKNGRTFNFKGYEKNIENIFSSITNKVKKKTAESCLVHKLIISSIKDGLYLNLEHGLEIENRYFLKSISSNQSRVMMRTFGLYKNSASCLDGLPLCDNALIENVGIVGAGMMGTGLALVCAKAGYNVSLYDISEKSLYRGLKYCKKNLNNKFLSNIKSSLDDSILNNSDLIIEAIFEDIELKRNIIKKIEPRINQNTILASNTSGLPITKLSYKFKNANNFIGMHFFSPVEKMQLVEIVLGKHTSEKTLARALFFVKSIKKIPIVVNDGYGFFTTRIFSTYVLEGAKLVAEGHDPILVEIAAKKLGMVVGPLQVLDEVTLKLVCDIYRVENCTDDHDCKGLKLLKIMINKHGRLGKIAKKGFYDYDGEKKIWSGLKNIIKIKPFKSGINFIKQRLMLSQCAEVARTIDDKILLNYRDAELGAVLGLGFAPQTGGPLSYMDNMGIQNIIFKLEKMKKLYGKRFKPAKILFSLAEKKQTFLN